MKKLFLGIFFFLSSFCIFAQSQYTTAIVEKYDTYTITIEFTAIVNEARIYFVTNQFSYEEGFARKKVQDRLDRFMEETRSENGYYSYRHFGDDEIKYDGQKKQATYIVHVVFYK